MPKDSKITHDRLLAAAAAILAEESLSNLNIDKISEKAGVSRRTFFSHFPTKDHLIAEVVGFMRPTYLDRYRKWSDSCGPFATVEERLQRIIECITQAAENPNWKGSCFIRVSAELGSQPGHPVHSVVTQANEDMEKWFDAELHAGGYPESRSIARQLVVMINGLLMIQLLTRSTSYGKDILQAMMKILSANQKVPPLAHTNVRRIGGAR